MSYKRVEGNVIREAEIGVLQPQTEEFSQTPEAERNKEQILPQNLQRSEAQLAPVSLYQPVILCSDFWTFCIYSSLNDTAEILCHKLILLQTPQQVIHRPRALKLVCVYVAACAGRKFGGECVCVLSHIQHFATPWTVARQAPLVYENFKARILEWVVIFLLWRIFLTQGSNLHLLLWQVDSLPLSFPRGIRCHLESPCGRMDTCVHTAESL